SASPRVGLLRTLWPATLPGVSPSAACGSPRPSVPLRRLERAATTDAVERGPRADRGRRRSAARRDRRAPSSLGSAPSRRGARPTGGRCRAHDAGYRLEAGAEDGLTTAAVVSALGFANRGRAGHPVARPAERDAAVPVAVDLRPVGSGPRE